MYKIKSFNQNSGQIVVQFDSVPSPCSIDVPLDESNLYITGEALDSYIKNFAPTEFISRARVIAAGVANANVIAALVEASEPTVDPVEANRLNEEARALEIEKFVKAALIKLGVISV